MILIPPCSMVFKAPCKITDVSVSVSDCLLWDMSLTAQNDQWKHYTFIVHYSLYDYNHYWISVWIVRAGFCSSALCVTGCCWLAYKLCANEETKRRELDVVVSDWSSHTLVLRNILGRNVCIFPAKVYSSLIIEEHGFYFKKNTLQGTSWCLLWSDPKVGDVILILKRRSPENHNTTNCAAVWNEEF